MFSIGKFKILACGYCTQFELVCSGTVYSCNWCSLVLFTVLTGVLWSCQQFELVCSVTVYNLNWCALVLSTVVTGVLWYCLQFELVYSVTIPRVCHSIFILTLGCDFFKDGCVVRPEPRRGLILSFQKLGRHFWLFHEFFLSFMYSSV